MSRPKLENLRIKTLVLSALLGAEALYRRAVITVRADFDCDASPRAAMVVAIERKDEVIEIQREAIRILQSGKEPVPAPRRPHYAPSERFAILQLQAKAGWNLTETATWFQLTPQTIASWRRVVKDGGEGALVEPRVPVNRFSDRIALIVKRLHARAPQLGKKKVAEMLERAGVALSASTIARLRKRKTSPIPPRKPRVATVEHENVVTATRPHHLWHVDITTVPIHLGMWLPFLPFALPNVWPFAWHIALVIDHFTRGVVAFAVKKKQPTGLQICRLLDRARNKAGTAPRHIVTDQGCQFQCEYRAWCKRHGPKPRYGAVGMHGSIAVIERFIGSLKREHLRRIMIPLRARAMEQAIARYVSWYNDHRPHSTLGGATPRQKRTGRPRVVQRIETRPRYPLKNGAVRRCEADLVYGEFAGHAHLPVIDLRVGA